MANSNKRFPYICNVVTFRIFLELFVDESHFLIKKDVADNSQRQRMLNVFNSLIVPVHADVGEQTHIVEQVSKFASRVVEKLGDGAWFFSSKSYFDHFIALIVVALIRHVFNLRSTVLHFESESIVNALGVVLVVFAIEELPENDLLVVPHDEILASDEGRKQSQMFSGHVSGC